MTSSYSCFFCWIWFVMSCIWSMDVNKSRDKCVFSNVIFPFVSCAFVNCSFNSISSRSFSYSLTNVFSKSNDKLPLICSRWSMARLALNNSLDVSYFSSDSFCIFLYAASNAWLFSTPCCLFESCNNSICCLASFNSSSTRPLDDSKSCISW